MVGTIKDEKPGHFFSSVKQVQKPMRAVIDVKTGHADMGGRGVLSQVSHCQGDVCREYEGNGRSVVGILRSDTRTCGTYLSLFGISPMLLPRVRRAEPAGSEKTSPPWDNWVAKTLGCHGERAV